MCTKKLEGTKKAKSPVYLSYSGSSWAVKMLGKQDVLVKTRIPPLLGSNKLRPDIVIINVMVMDHRVIVTLASIICLRMHISFKYLCPFKSYGKVRLPLKCPELHSIKTGVFVNKNAPEGNKVQSWIFLI